MSLTITAITFRLSDSASGRTPGWALLCPQMRYASIWWAGSPRADRRHLADWRNIEGEIALRLPAGPLPRDSAVRKLFSSGDHGVALRYVSAMPITLERSEMVAAVLDARLQQLVLEAASGGPTN